MTAILETSKLGAGYGQTAVVSGLDLTLRRGELVCLLGPNGAGKSTLMRTISGMQKPVCGEVRLEGSGIDGLSARDLARKLAVVLTDRVTTGMLTSYALVSLGRYPYTDWMGRLTEGDHRIIRQSIEAVGAEELAGRNISELSDGERQKVMLARALAQEPALMVLDEITAFLDLPRRVAIMRILRSLAHDQGRAILLSTHDLELALRTADKLWLLPKGGPLRAGTPEDLVLSGAFEGAFASEGVEFDRMQGHFRVHGSYHADVHLRGSGVEAFWTARALEREGFRVVSGASETPLQVEVTGAGWRVFQDGGWHPSLSLEQVIHRLRDRNAKEQR